MNPSFLRHVAALVALASLAAVWRPSSASLPGTSSRRLADTVAGGAMSAASSCKGSIDLLRATGSHATISVAELNALIADNDGALVLVVDVNEANGGLETGRAQGLAVRRAELQVAGTALGGGTANPAAGAYPFSTQTQALVAEAGSSTRQAWYTLLGDAGSNEVTPRNVDGRVFDSTLRIPVSGPIPASASDVKLIVEFVKTNTGLGDPEDFYDCTGGAEDMALVTQAIGSYFDLTVPTTTAFRTEAVAVQVSPEGEATLAQAGVSTPSYSWVLFPGANTFKVVGYEDLYPDAGDYDFNDAVVGYRWGLRVDANGMVDQVSGEAYLIARGSNYTHEWNLAIPVSGLVTASASCSTLLGDGSPAPEGRTCAIATDGGSIRWRAFDGTRTLLPPADNTRPQRNTHPGAVVAGPRATFTLVLATPVPLAAFGIDDPWLRVVDTGQEIHLVTRAPGSALPFALLVPSTFQVAIEGTDLVAAYPQFATFVGSGGSQGANWHSAPANGRVVDWTVGNWAWAHTF